MTYLSKEQIEKGLNDIVDRLVENKKEKGDYGWLQTYTGLKFFPLNPDINNIRIDDIAWALSNLCRFNGHCRNFYSVATHSIMVARIIWNATNVSRLALWGLLHDASEAYLGDIVRPLKHLPEFEFYREKEKTLLGMIILKLILPENYLDTDYIDPEYSHIDTYNKIADSEPEIVKQADRLLLYLEIENIRYPIHPDNAFKPGNDEHKELEEKLSFTKELKEEFLRMLDISNKRSYQSFIYDFNKYSK